jgi:hypothetical protein
MWWKKEPDRRRGGVCHDLASPLSQSLVLLILTALLLLPIPPVAGYQVNSDRDDQAKHRQDWVDHKPVADQRCHEHSGNIGRQAIYEIYHELFPVRRHISRRRKFRIFGLRVLARAGPAQIDLASSRPRRRGARFISRRKIGASMWPVMSVPSRVFVSL